MHWWALWHIDVKWQSGKVMILTWGHLRENRGNSWTTSQWYVNYRHQLTCQSLVHLTCSQYLVLYAVGWSRKGGVPISDMVYRCQVTHGVMSTSWARDSWGHMRGNCPLWSLLFWGNCNQLVEVQCISQWYGNDVKGVCLIDQIRWHMR